MQRITVTEHETQRLPGRGEPRIAHHIQCGGVDGR